MIDWLIDWVKAIKINIFIHRLIEQWVTCQSEWFWSRALHCTLRRCRECAPDRPDQNLQRLSDETSEVRRVWNRDFLHRWFLNTMTIHRIINTLQAQNDIILAAKQGQCTKYMLTLLFSNYWIDIQIQRDKSFFFLFSKLNLLYKNYKQ